MRKGKTRVRYFDSYDRDWVTSAKQDYRLPDDYKWVRHDPLSRLLSVLSYGTALCLSSIGCRALLHLSIKGRGVLRSTNGGAFIYGNHTRPVGDVFIPALASFPRRIYTVAAPANLGIPVIGRILPYLGALPTPQSTAGMRRLCAAISEHIENGKNIVIYPEAHVWEYCTEIRPMSESAFFFPAKLQKPSYAMTVTYKKRRIGKRPRTVVYIDGPFYPDTALPPRMRPAALRDAICAAMTERARENDAEYIKYVKIPEQAAPRRDAGDADASSMQ